MLARIKRWLSPKPQPEIAEAAWRAVEDGLPCLAHLDHEERQALRSMALAFLERKVFSGAHGFVPDNTVRLSLALQACLLVLKLGLHAYDGWQGIIVYPGGFLIPQRRVDSAGVMHEYAQEALGQAWEDGPVLIAWTPDSPLGAAGNVVIHEFAHKLDMLDGVADGRPPLPPGISPQRWKHVFTRAYEDFCWHVDNALPTFMDAYAAEHPAEFFAMCSEAFFCQPRALHRHYPEVHDLLCSYFQQHPLPEEPLPD